MRLARDIVKKIEEGMEYPGQIKVTVVKRNPRGLISRS